MCQEQRNSSERERCRKGKNPEFWEKKILRNMERDNENNKQLFYMGWIVIRFWGNEIIKNTDECVRVIEECIFEQEIYSWDDIGDEKWLLE